jgi:hypothetical protein
MVRLLVKRSGAGGPASVERGRIKQGLIAAALLACLLSLISSRPAAPPPVSAPAVQDELAQLEQRLAMQVAKARLAAGYVTRSGLSCCVAASLAPLAAGPSCLRVGFRHAFCYSLACRF